MESNKRYIFIVKNLYDSCNKKIQMIKGEKYDLIDIVKVIEILNMTMEKGTIEKYNFELLITPEIPNKIFMKILDAQLFLKTELNKRDILKFCNILKIKWEHHKFWTEFLKLKERKNDSITFKSYDKKWVENKKPIKKFKSEFINILYSN